MLSVIVIGASGQIGGWLQHWLERRGDRVLGTYASKPYPGLVRLDATNLDAVTELIVQSRPDVVFYPAGFTWVDGCERDPRRAFEANVQQPLHAARVTRDCGGRFVYYSTDYVFDGAGGPYFEDSPTHPLSVYGKSKREAELALVSELGDRQLTIRTSWVFGPERQGKNFAYQLVSRLRAGLPLECPSDQYSSPSFGPDVAKISVELVEHACTGLIHVAGPRPMSRIAFAAGLAEGFGLDSSLLVPKLTSELGQTAQRPLQGGLLSKRLPSLGIEGPSDLPRALADFRGAVEHDRRWLTPEELG
jgi:dTDP-4-dehydrorhamnose reductase